MEVKVPHAYAMVHRVWMSSKAPDSELAAAFTWTHAAHDFAKDQVENKSQPANTVYVVTELADGKQTFYRKELVTDAQ